MVGDLVMELAWGLGRGRGHARNLVRYLSRAFVRYLEGHLRR